MVVIAVLPVSSPLIDWSEYASFKVGGLHRWTILVLLLHAAVITISTHLEQLGREPTNPSSPPHVSVQKPPSLPPDEKANLPLWAGPEPPQHARPHQLVSR